MKSPPPLHKNRKSPNLLFGGVFLARRPACLGSCLPPGYSYIQRSDARPTKKKDWKRGRGNFFFPSGHSLHRLPRDEIAVSIGSKVRQTAGRDVELQRLVNELWLGQAGVSL